MIIDYRDFAGDCGPAVRASGEIGQGRVHVLRFDCFDKVPHYHDDPDGMNVFHALDRTGMPDVEAWTVAQFRCSIKAMWTVTS